MATFRSKATSGLTTSLANIGSYTAPAGTATVIGCSISNTSGAAITVDVALYLSAVAYYIVKGAPVPVGGTLVVVGGDQKIVLNSGDSIQAKASAGASADAIMSILEV
jgi:hypothetical protein